MIRTMPAGRWQQVSTIRNTKMHFVMLRLVRFALWKDLAARIKLPRRGDTIEQTELRLTNPAP